MMTIFLTHMKLMEPGQSQGMDRAIMTSYNFMLKSELKEMRRKKMIQNCGEPTFSTKLMLLSKTSKKSMKIWKKFMPRRKMKEAMSLFN